MSQLYDGSSSFFLKDPAPLFAKKQNMFFVKGLDPLFMLFVSKGLSTMRKTNILQARSVFDEASCL